MCVRRCINYNNNKLSGHYSGNFWWARNDYIASLPKCEDTRKAPESFINCGMQPGNTNHIDVVPESLDKKIYDKKYSNEEFLEKIMNPKLTFN